MADESDNSIMNVNEVSIYKYINTYL